MLDNRQRKLHAHHVRRRQDQYQQSSLRFELCLHHVRQQSKYFRDLEVWLKYQSVVDYRVDANQYLAHPKHKARRQAQSRSEWQGEFFGLPHPIALLRAAREISNPSRRPKEIPAAH